MFPLQNEFVAFFHRAGVSAVFSWQTEKTSISPGIWSLLDAFSSCKLTRQFAGVPQFSIKFQCETFCVCVSVCVLLPAWHLHKWQRERSAAHTCVHVHICVFVCVYFGISVVWPLSLWQAWSAKITARLPSPDSCWVALNARFCNYKSVIILPAFSFSPGAKLSVKHRHSAVLQQHLHTRPHGRPPTHKQMPTHVRAHALTHTPWQSAVMIRTADIDVDWNAVQQSVAALSYCCNDGSAK